MPPLNITPTNEKDYNRSYNGQALKVVIIRGEVTPGAPINPKNIAARANGFTYNVDFSHTETEEINTTHTQETNLGAQMVGRGTLEVVFNLKANDQLPSADTIRTDPEYTILELTGDDHPMTVDGVPTILNAFTGVRLLGKAGGTRFNQPKMLQVPLLFRRHYDGAQWKALVGDAVNYPANVSVA